MILPDINLLLYAHIDSFPQHQPSRAWWNAAMNSTTPVALAEPVVFGFIRVATHRKVFSTPLPVYAALACARGWLEHDGTRWISQTPASVRLAFELLEQVGTAGNLTTDAQLAALAIDNQATLFSADADFARFPGLRWTNPLAG